MLSLQLVVKTSHLVRMIGQDSNWNRFASTLAVASPLPTFAAQHMIGLSRGAASYDGMAL
jgi:hypothetical protein